MIDSEKVMQTIRTKGPVVPMDIVRAVGGNTLFAGAHLSELVARKKISISYGKIGGSPLYYIQGQEPKLQAIYNYLNEKEKRAFDLLKEKKVLRDTALTPVERVALRAIKDFAHPLNVTIGQSQELFWKWYLLSNNDAERIIKSIMSIKDEEEPQKQEEKAKEQVQEKKPAQKEQKEEPKEPKKEHEIKLEETEKRFEEERKKMEEERKRLSEELDKLRKQLEQKSKEVEAPVKEQQASIEKFGQKQEPLKPKIEEVNDPLIKKVREYCSQNKVKIIDYEIIRKNTEADFIVRIPSVVGDVEYYCKVKDKKKISDGDISSAYVQGQAKKLPVLFITTGELTKKAQLMLDKEFKNSLFVKQI